MKPKTLSIVIASYNSDKTLERCLRSLEAQVRGAQVPTDVIVVDSSAQGAVKTIAARFPRVKLLTFLERKYPGEARNLGVAQAAGDLIAFLDADCVADENWLAEILQSHESETLAVGGAVDNGNPESYVGWGYYFGEFSRWSPQTPPGPMHDIPACCLSVKRSAFERYGPFLEGVYCSDTDFNWKLDQAGHPPLFNPGIKVSHINPTRLSVFLRHEIEHGRAFAELRVNVEKFSRLRSLVYALGAPLLPFLLFIRVARRVISYNLYPRQFLWTAPLAFLGLAAWSFGEALGYSASLAAFSRLVSIGSPCQRVNY